MHEFQASKETIGGYKAGDPIKAKLRVDPRCNQFAAAPLRAYSAGDCAPGIGPYQSCLR